MIQKIFPNFETPSFCGRGSATRARSHKNRAGDVEYAYLLGRVAWLAEALAQALARLRMQGHAHGGRLAGANYS